MTAPFRSFVIFAEMRTGSNLLEATLNAVRRVTCFGEAFNPYLMGWPDKDELLGVTRAEREADPMPLLARLTDKPDHLPGFRYFHDHDPRVFDAIMENRACAKIVLMRNPLDSYVSTRLAWETNQWKLNASETPIPARITYDGPEFRALLSDISQFQARVQRRLQATGQAAFWLGYDDLRDPAVMTGLLHWLGRTDLERVEAARDQVPQNPRDLAGKVQNFDEMMADLQDLDLMGLHRVPNFEPGRGPAVPGFVANDAGRGLIYMPVRGGPVGQVRAWMGGQGGPLADGFTQTTLRQWKRAHPGHRSFTVLRHPLLRAWDAFGRLCFEAAPEMRGLMRDLHRVPLPSDDRLADLPEDRMASLFGDFLGFLQRNLNGQTTLPTHSDWATQTEVIAGFSRFGAPDMLIREADLSRDLAWLAQAAGLDAPAMAGLLPDPRPGFLSDPGLTKAAHAAYQRDYVAFGFDRAP